MLNLLLDSTSLGRRDSGFASFAYDVTRSLNAGAENRLDRVETSTTLAIAERRASRAAR